MWIWLRRNLSKFKKPVVCIKCFFISRMYGVALAHGLLVISLHKTFSPEVGSVLIQRDHFTVD